MGGEDPPPSVRELTRALRYPDRSVVVDLYRLPQDAKVQYIQSILPALNLLRRRTGLPHRIVIDEAHYFLHGEEAGRLLDLERNGYTVATFCASRLPKALLDATEVMIVTCESNPVEVGALLRCCETRAPAGADDWELIQRLRPGQAVALPITAEAGGQLRLFTVATRLTPHVRHRQKYVDVPVSEQRAFVFAPAARSRTLRDFVTRLEHLPAASLDPFIHRGDFSRWIKDVFGDHVMAADMRTVESRHRAAPNPDTVAALVDVIRARYDLRDDGLLEAG
jgi:hypothetical protein